MVVVFALCLAFTRDARADEVDDFVFARDAYNNTDYNIARERLQEMLDRVPPINPLLVEPARKLLFVSLLFTDRRDQAIALLERILRENPDVQFSTRDFSGAVTQLVAETRERLAPELARIRTDRGTRTRAEAEARQRQRDAAIEQLSRERVSVRSSRALMFVPFGVGQFVNRQYAWGAVYATVEAAALATALSTFVALQNLGLPYQDPGHTRCTASACTALIVGNTAGWAVLGAAIIAGVIHANVSYVPEHVEYRRRPLTPDIRRLLISGGPTENGVILGATLRF